MSIHTKIEVARVERNGDCQTLDIWNSHYL